MLKQLVLLIILNSFNVIAQDGIDIIQNEKHWKPCSYDTLIKDSLVIEASANAKPILLFFYAVHSVNCLKFLSYSGFDIPLQKQIEQYFTPILLQVDRKDAIPEIRNPYIEGQRKKITYGDRFLAFQSELLSNQVQPVFAVLDKKGNLVSSIDFIRKLDNCRVLFETFLIDSYKLILDADK